MKVRDEFNMLRPAFISIGIVVGISSIPYLLPYLAVKILEFLGL